MKKIYVSYVNHKFTNYKGENVSFRHKIIEVPEWAIRQNGRQELVNIIETNLNKDFEGLTASDSSFRCWFDILNIIVL